jgi:hypothetical protein
MHRGLRTAFAVVGIVGLLAAGPGASAKGGNDVTKRGSCSAQSEWKLKLSPDNGKIEVEFEVDQNKVGDTWRVAIRENGNRVFRGKRVTRGPSGSFTVRTLARNPAGSDSFKATAANLSTNESCVGRASI